MDGADAGQVSTKTNNSSATSCSVEWSNSSRIANASNSQRHQSRLCSRSSILSGLDRQDKVVFSR